MGLKLPLLQSYQTNTNNHWNTFREHYQGGQRWKIKNKEIMIKKFDEISRHVNDDLLPIWSIVHV